MDGAKAFYGSLFGWSFEDIESDAGLLYSMAQIEGYNVCGLGPMDPALQAEGVLPFWTSYVKHIDADALAEKASVAKAEVLMSPYDVMDSGRMTMFEDPTGAMIGVWQPKEHIGAQLVNVFNTLVWNELQTGDLDAAKAFYATVFDWTYELFMGKHLVCKAGDRGHAGMVELGEEEEDATPNWRVYFLVQNAAATAEKAEELGGRIVTPSTSLGEHGRYAVLMDPQGAQFSLHEYDGPAEPPPGY